MNIGVIFDWDGVIIDSSKQHEKSWEILAKDENLSLPNDHFIKGFGQKNEVIIPGLLKWSNDPIEIKRLSIRKEELYREIVKTDGLNPLPGVIELLKNLQTAGIPFAVGSSTPFINIETIVSVINLENTFTEIVCGDDVSKGKPDPEVFLLAAKKINIPPQNCIVFEDAHVGIDAALSGGMKVIAVATTHQPSELTKAHKVVNTLEEVSIDQLYDLIN